MVTDRYMHVHHHPAVDGPQGLAAWARDAGLPVLGVDNLPGAVPLETFALPRECVLLLGQEGSGLSTEARQACTQVLSVAQFGSTRSIIAGAAAAVAMHAWVRRHVFGQQPVT
jgi:tRNA G18 (ribose-2'-O)-methylase SpoU